jgi:hypothetical protein
LGGLREVYRTGGTLGDEFAEELEGLAKAAGDAGFLAGEGFEEIVGGTPGGGEVHVADGGALGEGEDLLIEPADGFAVGVDDGVSGEGFFLAFDVEAGLGAIEAGEADAAEGDFFEAVAFEGGLGFVELGVFVEELMDLGAGDGVVKEGGIADADAEFEAVSGGNGFAFGGPGTGGLEGVEAAGSALFSGTHGSFSLGGGRFQGVACSAIRS